MSVFTGEPKMLIPIIFDTDKLSLLYQATGKDQVATIQIDKETEDAPQENGAIEQVI